MAERANIYLKARAAPKRLTSATSRNLSWHHDMFIWRVPAPYAADERATTISSRARSAQLVADKQLSNDRPRDAKHYLIYEASTERLSLKTLVTFPLTKRR